MKYHENMTQEELDQFMAEVNARDAAYASAAEHYARMEQEQLIDQVLRQIVSDVEYGDLTAIEELLRCVPESNLKGYLAEDLD